MFKFFGRNPFVLFYIVSGYILVFTLWWGYLLASKNEQAFTEKVELNRVAYEAQGNKMKYEDTDSYLKLYSKYERQKVMIVGEGAFFLILQVLGLLQVRSIFSKEIALAAQQRNFLHSITHELKSPLSSVKLSLETMLKRQLTPEQQGKLINNALGDVVRLEGLVDNILFAAKIERDTHGFANEEVNLSDIVELVAAKFRENKNRVSIRADVEEGIYYHTDQIGFTSVIINLIENAIKYSRPDTNVVVALRQADKSILLEVKDEGYGIPDAEKKKVFEKFYRIGSEDTRKTKGTGLGLFIVKRFVEIYKGKIELSDNTGGGSIFRLSFPV
ncbi:MAG: HAMP domain-containing histidine kinase [Bacteroidetes bacterium]|nr:HAMP domain-containing histidine kinase [Bacteroidota bacterium]